MSVYLLDKHAPLVKVICRQRGSSDRWYDAECRSTKRKVRRHERLCKNHRSDHSYQKSIDALCGLHRMIDFKRGRYWMEHVKTHRNPAELCRVIDEGMCRTREHSSGRPPGPSADNLADYFQKKVADIRAATCDAPPPEFLDIQTDVRLHCFASVTVDGVRALISASKNKYSSLDPMPT